MVNLQHRRQSRVAILPARGGSKRLPRKNIIEIGGRPMLAWTIDAALTTDCFDQVVVSTDDEEIAEIARKYGAEVPFLRSAHFDDISPVSTVTISVLNDLQKKLGLQYETVAQLMVNCPLRTANDIVSALDSFEQKRRKLQLSCFRFGWQNPWWALELKPGGRGKRLFELDAVRSQDLPPLYCPTGAIWIARVAALREEGSFYGSDHRYEPMAWSSAVDIDDEDDLAFARTIFAMRQSEEG